jgi:small-conductance mechanosensitive channel
MPFASTVLNRASETFGAYLPRLGAFLALILIGYLVAAIAGRIVAKALESVGLDGLAERTGITRELTGAGIDRPLSRLIGTAIRVAILVISIIAAISALGLSALNTSLNSAVLFLPKLFIALLLLLAGVVVGRYARERVEHSATRMDLAGPLGTLTQVGIVAVFATTALAELSVSLVILTIIVAIVIAAACFAAALAFGLGSRDTARQITAGRTLASSLHVGQRITINDHHGTIEAFESAALLLRTDETVLLRIPNHYFLEGVMTIHETDE